MLKLDIAGIRIEVISEDFETISSIENLCNRIKFFCSNNPKKPDLIVRVECRDCIEKPIGKMLIADEYNWVLLEGNKKGFAIYTARGATNEISALVEIDEAFTSAQVYYLRNAFESDYSDLKSLSEILFRHCIIFHQGLAIHAAGIEWEGNGILFSAPSGTGKSTQANLWEMLMGAKVLNGDRPVVTAMGEGAVVFGTPWSGSSPDFLNRQAPLSAIIMLEQAPHNSIRRLEKHEISAYLLPRCFLPYSYRNHMEMALNNLEKILTSTPVYLLRCRPDREAVELVAQCLK